MTIDRSGFAVVAEPCIVTIRMRCAGNRIDAAGLTSLSRRIGDAGYWDRRRGDTGHGRGMSDDRGSHGSGNVRSLSAAVRRVRTAEAERSDVVVELRDVERARLEMLADELKGVFAEIPEDNDTFLLDVAAGVPPRLWIDVTTFVVMGRDRRTYRFLKDTRLGRTVILESANLDDVADCVTNYLAERIVERDRAIEGDWLMRRVSQRDGTGRRDVGKASVARPPAPEWDGGQRAWMIAALLLGVLIGIVGLLGYAWVSVPL
jgi:hypothetical protein